MNARIMQTCEDIMTLLDLSHRPISLKNISYYLGVPYYVINFSLARLIRENQISIEVHGKENYVAKTADPSDIQAEAPELQNA